MHNLATFLTDATPVSSTRTSFNVSLTGLPSYGGYSYLLTNNAITKAYLIIGDDAEGPTCSTSGNSLWCQTTESGQSVAAYTVTIQFQTVQSLMEIYDPTGLSAGSKNGVISSCTNCTTLTGAIGDHPEIVQIDVP